MSSARFQLLEAVLGELGQAQARSSSHSPPPVARNRGKSVGTRPFFPCPDSAAWPLWIMCQHRPPACPS